VRPSSPLRPRATTRRPLRARLLPVLAALLLYVLLQALLASQALAATPVDTL